MAGKGKREVQRTHAEGVRHHEEAAVSTRTMTTTQGYDTLGLRAATGDCEILPSSYRDGRAKCGPGPARTTLYAAALYPGRLIPARHAGAALRRAQYRCREAPTSYRVPLCRSKAAHAPCLPPRLRSHAESTKPALRVAAAMAWVRRMVTRTTPRYDSDGVVALLAALHAVPIDQADPKETTAGARNPAHDAPSL
jgi:hypothetical protein